MTPAWHRSYRRRHPLTESNARTLDEVDDDAYRSWWEGPQAGDRGGRWLSDATCCVAWAAFLLVIVTAPRWWAAFFGA